MNLSTALTLGLILIGSGIASAKAPKPPSNLRVKPLGVNSFLMEWQDNSKNETGWEIRVALGAKSKPQRYYLNRTANITSYVVLTNELPGETLTFQLAAFNGAAGAEKFSKPTSVVAATALDTSTFGAPVKLTARTLDDGRIRIAWKDKSTTEQGCQIQYKVGSGKWKTLGNTNPDVKFSFELGTFPIATNYSFRVRAFKQNPPVYTKFSNVATAATLPFNAPSSLVATAEGDGAISLKWKDLSSHEAGYEIESKTGTGAFTKLGDVAANVSSTGRIPGFALNTDFQFRIRAFRLVDGVRVYTDYSNLASTKTTSIASPTALAGQPVDEATVRLTWNDASAREAGFQIQYREAGASNYSVAGTVAANIKEYTVSGLSAGKTYDFKVRAYTGFYPYFPTYSAFTPAVQVLTKDGFTGDLDPPIFWNTSFNHTIGISRLSQLNSLVMTGSLPAGITYNPATRKISGTTSFEGVNTVSLKATFKDGRVVTRPYTLRVIRPPSTPLVAASFAPVNVAAGSSSSASITGKFSDPDTLDARRVNTTKGNFDIILYSLATPATVANFLSYATAGRYDGMFFHRSISNFVVQGGGYRHDGSVFTGVPKSPAVQNEPGISNVAGTVAMAKLPDDPNSATSEFFVSVNNNAAILDDQNGGFTVFGRVAGTGMTILDQINDLPVANYTVSVDGASRRLENVPMNTTETEAPAVMDPTKLVKVTSVAVVPILRYEVVSADTAVATAVVSGSNVDITGVATGSTTITVKAFDLDGQMASQTIPVTVP
jgi:cyclophilin family peptidyl-prolyl cis-trans isomerase